MSQLLTELHTAADRISLLEEATFNEAERRVRLTFDFSPPWKHVDLELSEDYIKRYPFGMCSFVVGSRYFVISAAEALPVHDVFLRVLQTVKFEMSDVASSGMGSATNTGVSWAVEPTLELLSGGSHNHDQQQGTFLPGLHESVLEAVESLPPSRVTAVEDHPSLDLLRIVLNIPLVFSKLQLEAYDLEAAEPLLVELRLCRSSPFSEKRCTVEVGQKRNFAERNFCGAAGAITLIAQRFCDTFLHSQMQNDLRALLWKGFSGDVVADTLRQVEEVAAGDTATRVAKCIERLNQKGISAVPPPTRIPIPAENAPMTQQLLSYIEWRMEDLPSCCALCGERHKFKTLSRLSLCNSPYCQFRFEELGLGKNFGLAQVIQSGVADLLVNLAIAAATSGRWRDIFNPYPSIASVDGHPPILPSTKETNHALVQRVFSSFPSTFTVMTSSNVVRILSEVHPIAPKLFDWVISSNATQLVKLDSDKHVDCMKTRHQFMMSSGSDDRAETFRKLVEKHGYVWAFHGSRVENWHSILRNGLRNVSGTTLQVNGAAYGKGVYLSPHSSVSVSYSNMNGNSTSGGILYNMSDTDESKFLDRESMRCIAVCQVANTGIQKNGNIWVQPDENAVFTRFFFVYQKGMGLSMQDTEAAQVKKEFDECLSRCVSEGLIK